MNIPFYIGLLGMILLLSSFAIETINKSKEGLLYLILNFLGSCAMVYYARTIPSLPFLILNIAWTVFAIYGLLGFIWKIDKQKQEPLV